MVYLIFHILLAEFIISYISNIEAPSNLSILSFRPESRIMFLIGNIALVFFSVLFTLYVTEYLESFFVRVSVALALFAMADLSVYFLHSSEVFERVGSVIMKILCFAGAFVIVLLKIDDIQFDYSTGFTLEAAPVLDVPGFEGFTWFILAIAIFIYFIPLVSIIISIINMAVKKRYAKVRQLLFNLFSLIIPWASLPVIGLFIIESFPQLPLILFLMLIGVETMVIRRIKRSDTRNTNIVYFLLNSSQYLLPALLLGLLTDLIIPLSGNPVLFWFLFAVIILAVLFLTNWYGEIIINGRRKNNRRQMKTFENELKQVDYSLDRNEVTDNFAHIINKYLRTSAVAIYSNDGNEQLVPLFDSRDDSVKEKLPFYKSSEAFLLKANFSVLRKSDLDSTIDFGNTKACFKNMYAKTRTNGFLVIYNRQHVVALIFLGRKVDNSDFTRYDIGTMEKLYSYFFIFTYYLMNVASKKSKAAIESDSLALAELTEAVSKCTLPAVTEKYDVGTFLKTATISSGDFFDSIDLGGSRTLFVMGTISGMGIASTVSAMLLKETIHALLPSTPDFKELVVKINRYICHYMPKGIIFSGMFAIANFAKDDFYYINCGIQSVSVFSSDLNKIFTIQGDGKILGFVDNIDRSITVQKRHMKKDDIIFCYTEGIVKSPTVTGYYKKEQQLESLLFANTAYNSERIAKFMYDDFSKMEEIDSDVSILVMKRKA